MSKLWRRRLPGVVLFFAMAPLALPVILPHFVTDRFRGPDVQVHDVQGIPDRVQAGKLYLRLKDFIALVLKNNTEINLTRLDVWSAADAILSAKAPFDPNLSTSFNSTRALQPQSSQIGGASQLNTLTQNSTLNFQQTLSSGQTVNLGFNAFRTSTNNQFVYFNPNISTGLNFSITQPLLQGRANLQLRAPLMIARTQLLITSEQSEARIADLVANAARQYWDAIQSRDNIKVQQQAYDLAQKSYERDKLALDLGALPALDIFQSQSQVAQRKVGVIQAQYEYRDALDGLRRLIGADLNPVTRNIEIVLEDDPAPTLIPVVPVEEGVAAALQKRPELSAIRRHQGINELNARVARDSMLPRFDLSAIGGAFGLGGNQIPVSGPLGTGPSTFIPGGLGDALHQMFAFQAPSYGFAVQMTLPIRSSAAQASLADALVGKARDEYQQRQLEQQIIQDVKNATNQLEMSAAQIDAAKIARDLAQKNVEAEQQKYELGSITAFEVLDAQSRLATVEGSLLQAYTGYQRALISYQRAVWTLLDGMGMIVETPKVR
ncbi:MAG: TolC family protein [Acidobacteriia bacterium]|nr:TolC family protein [Terriglobia bacterium]